MRFSRLPVMRPSFPPTSNYLPRLEDVRKSGIYSNYGPQVKELELRFANRFRVNSGQVAVLSNATAALTGLVHLVKPATTWIVPTWTFSASALAVAQGGGRISFADVGFESHRVPDHEWTHSETALITLPFGTGIPETWIAQKQYPRVIDAAASLATVTDLSRLPEDSSIVFSLHATKYLGIGEGAVVVSGSEAVIDELRAWTNFGFSGSNESTIIGTNAKMSEFQAVIAHCVLDSEVETKKMWTNIRALSIRVSEQLGIDIPEISHRSIAPYWIVDLKNESRRKQAEILLEKRNIQTRRWWSSGCHRMPAFAHAVGERSYPITDELAARVLGLPFYIGMPASDFERIFDALSAISD